MKVHIKIFLILLLIGCFQMSMGQHKDNPELKPADITTGQMDNGLHYYIMHNKEPKDRVSFYFAQKVGSILEEESQRGLAHFLEHMAFNGTEHFPNKRMLEYLEKNSIKFGNEINAATHYDETIYRIQNVPVENEHLLDSILLILHDWSDGLTLTAAEIDNERGVVREEWRSRYTAQRRAADSILNRGLLKDSRYAKRGVIGTMDVIDNFKYEELRDYYQKWYRPDLQAVIIVGDIDEKKMEEKVKKLFSGIPLEKDRPKRKKYSVKVGDDFTYLNLKNKELGTTSIEYFLRYEVDPTLTEIEMIQNEVKLDLLTSIIDRRFIKTADLPSSPVYSARFTDRDYTLPKNIGILKSSLQPKKDSLLPALKMAGTELQRFWLHGANQDEFDRVKSYIAGGLKSKIGRGGSSNIYHAIEISEAFFRNFPVIDYTSLHQYELDYLEGLKKEDILNFFKQYYTVKGNVVAILGSDEIKYPSKKEIFNTIKDANNAKLEPYKEVEVKAKKLMDLELRGGKVILEEHLKDSEGTKFLLSNGAEVFLYPILDKDDKMVYFRAISPGGRSQLDKELLDNSLFAYMFAEASGIANLTKKELAKSNEVIVPSVKIGEYEETMDRYSYASNLENVLKGIFLAFTEPRFDESAFDGARQNLKNLNKMLHANNRGDFSDSLKLAIANGNPREVYLGEKLLNSLSMEKMETVYKDRIKNAADFRFIFMGDIEKEVFIPLIEEYIGSLPGDTTATEHIVDHGMKPTKGITKVHISQAMETPQTTVSLYITDGLPYNQENKLAIAIIAELLEKRYMERIREEEGGTYGVRVKGNLLYIPEDHFTLSVNFNCNPSKTDRLVEIVYEELHALSNEVDSAKLLEVKTNLIKEMGDRKDNSMNHLEKIISSIETNTAISSYENDIDRVESLTAADIIKVAKKINDNPRIVEGILAPETQQNK
ncbi:zinc protease [Leeuwenhoekiella aestuarii]|uniref:Zinc protease n=1 Tax=Leeuwenhoekiella aestuarii TaxID=2249426 RepID=A0A4Q0NP33_9FLAO|nr:M16 family metallopeptidase [Leeuwenhoekiella aestuarii]RXG11904.1 zinc protease [Leeuwenhoekiella aestuarii]RXG13462.1 zinc protease [Leeuwenhoekiella aestuarii]